MKVNEESLLFLVVSTLVRIMWKSFYAFLLWNSIISQAIEGVGAVRYIHVVALVIFYETTFAK